MKCQRCREREAVIHYIEIDEDTKTNLWICEACAREEGISIDEDEAAAGMSIRADGGDAAATGLEGFIGGLLDGAAEPAARPDETADLVCHGCGYSYASLQENHLLGCPECYAAFRSRLLPMLRRYHSEVGHVGKAPRADGPRAALRRDLAALKVDLHEAIAREDYENAARLRDAIRDKETELARGGAAEAGGPADPAEG